MQLGGARIRAGDRQGDCKQGAAVTAPQAHFEAMLNGPIVAHGADDLFRTDHLNTSQHPQPFHLRGLPISSRHGRAGATMAPRGLARILAREGLLASGSANGAPELPSALLEIRPFIRGALSLEFAGPSAHRRVRSSVGCVWKVPRPREVCGPRPSAAEVGHGTP